MKPALGRKRGGVVRDKTGLTPVNLLRGRLGQRPVEIPFQVVVTDVQGIPFEDALVTATANGRPLYDVSTDAQGRAIIPAREGAIDIRVEAAGYVVNRQVVGTDETLFIQIPVCAPQPFLSTPELVALAVSAAITGAGFYFKQDFLKTAGEIGFGAVVFTALGRHSCGR
jgi:hypothetical protein